MNPMPLPKVEITSAKDGVLELVTDIVAPRELVFRGLTEPALIRQWLLGPDGWDMPVCEVDLRVGGRYRYGWSHPDYPAFEMSGVYQEIQPPERIVHTEVYEGSEALITTVFDQVGERTRLTMTMVFPSQEALEATVATGMTSGMTRSYERLQELLAAGV